MSYLSEDRNNFDRLFFILNKITFNLNSKRQRQMNANNMENSILETINQHSIEKSILVTILEKDFINIDKRILSIELNPNLFKDSFHRLLVKSIKKLRELDEPTTTDLIRDKFLQSKKWHTEHDNKLSEIIIHTPLVTFDLFNSYYNVLKKQDKNKLMEI